MPSFKDLYYGKFFSTAKQSDKIDFDVHDVRKLAQLIFKGNINFLEVLFSREEEHAEELNFLFENRERWVEAVIPHFRNATYGMHLEKLKTLHKGTAKTQRLIDEFGYDTKDACHALRCLYTLEKYWDTQSMEKALWYNKGKKRTVLLDVKAGKYTEEEFMALVQTFYSKWNDEMKKNYDDTLIDGSVQVKLEKFMFGFVQGKMMAGL